MYFWKISILLYYLFYTEVVFAENLRISPTLISKSEVDEIIVTYEVTCNSRLKGFVIRPSGTDVLIGALMITPKYACTGLSHFEVSKIPKIRSSFKNFYSMRPGMTSRNLRLTSFEQLQIVQEGPLSAKLQGSYHSKCQTPIGFMIPKQKNKSFLLLQKTERGTQNSDPGCSKKLRAIEWGGLKFTSHKLQGESPNSYALFKTPVKLINTQEKGGISFRYLGKCNDSPIGPVFHSQNGIIYVSMLVARYAKFPCRASPKEYWQPHLVTQIDFEDSHSQILPAPVRKATKVTLSTPLRIWKKSRSFSVSTLEGCKRLKGIALVEKGNSLLVSAVMNSQGPISRCQKFLKQINYTVEGITIGSRVPLRPLKIARSQGRYEKYNRDQQTSNSVEL